MEVILHLAETSCAITTERSEVDFEYWLHHVKVHYQQQDPDVQFSKEEWRTVNGIQLYHMAGIIHYGGSIQYFYGYYAKGKEELISLFAVAPRRVVADVEPHIARLLNGLILNHE